MHVMLVHACVPSSIGRPQRLASVVLTLAVFDRITKISVDKATLIDTTPMAAPPAEAAQQQWK